MLVLDTKKLQQLWLKIISDQTAEAFRFSQLYTKAVIESFINTAKFSPESSHHFIEFFYSATHQVTKLAQFGLWLRIDDCSSHLGLIYLERIVIEHAVVKFSDVARLSNCEKSLEVLTVKSQIQEALKILIVEFLIDFFITSFTIIIILYELTKARTRKSWLFAAFSVEK